MESALYGIYALVVFVWEILLVRCAHSFDFWYVNNSCVNTVASTFHEVFSIYTDPKFPRKPYPIRDQNALSAHPFSGKKGAKTLPDGTAHTYMAYIREYPPPPPREVTRIGGVTCACLSISSLILIWSRLHDRWGDQPHVTSPLWGPSPPCKQALRDNNMAEP